MSCEARLDSRGAFSVEPVWTERAVTQLKRGKEFRCVQVRPRKNTVLFAVSGVVRDGTPVETRARSKG